MSNELDNFEKAIRESLNSHEVPYNAEHWKEMSAKLDQLPGAGGGSSAGPWVVAASIGAAVITTAVILYNTMGTDASTETAELNPTEITEEQTTTASEDQEIAPQNTDNTTEEGTQVVSEDGNDSQESPTGDSGASGNESSNDTPGDAIQHPEIQPDNGGNESIEFDAPEADFTVSTATVCEGESITFKPAKVNDHLAFEWNFGDGNTSNKIQPTYLYKAGEFTPTLTVTDVRTGKTTTNDIGPVVVNELPELSFRWSIDESDIEPLYLFENTSNYNEVVWSFGDGTTSTAENPDHDFGRKGLYDVTMSATSDHGCAASTTQKVPVDRLFNLFVQNAFTPNGDGDNDFFMPKGLEVLDVTFQMSIYNAKGELVFETDNYNNPWDGLMKDGQMIQDTYVWIVVMKTPDGEEDIHRGTITLIK